MKELCRKKVRDLEQIEGGKGDGTVISGLGSWYCMSAFLYFLCFVQLLTQNCSLRCLGSTFVFHEVGVHCYFFRLCHVKKQGQRQ